MVPKFRENTKGEKIAPNRAKQMGIMPYGILFFSAHGKGIDQKSYAKPNAWNGNRVKKFYGKRLLRANGDVSKDDSTYRTRGPHSSVIRFVFVFDSSISNGSRNR